ncbi:MAG: hypothetical protein J5863_07265 [Desulfovibrio sp.]|nr:hypothetical protein [Desulfovibrio sp.]
MTVEEAFWQEQERAAGSLAAMRPHLARLGAAFWAVLKRHDPGGGLIAQASQLRVRQLRESLGSTRLESTLRLRFERLFDQLACSASAVKQA